MSSDTLKRHWCDRSGEARAVIHFALDDSGSIVYAVEGIGVGTPDEAPAYVRVAYDFDDIIPFGYEPVEPPHVAELIPLKARTRGEAIAEARRLRADGGES